MVWCEITIASKSLVTIFPASAAEVEHRGGGRERTETTRGKGSGKKVERENRECTCNLTVMKGTPRKECNTTKESVGWGLTKKEKDLEFPTHCLRTRRLPHGQAGLVK